MGKPSTGPAAAWTPRLPALPGLLLSVSLPSEPWALGKPDFGNHRRSLFGTLSFVVLDIPNRLKRVWELEWNFP